VRKNKMVIQEFVNWFSLHIELILWIGGAIALFVIYVYLPDQIKSAVKGVFLNYGFYIFLIVLVIYGWNKWGYVRDYPNLADMHYALFLAISLALLYFAVSSWLFKERYYTNHVIADNVSGSCNRIQEIEGTDGLIWVVCFLGTSGSSDEKFVVPWPWCQKILVAPKMCCEFVGNQLLVKAQCPKVDLYDTDENVCSFIKNDPFGRWCQDEIFMGIAPAEVRTLFPNYRKLEQIIKKQNDRINEQDDMLKGKLTRSKIFISDTMAMTDKLRGKERQRSGGYSQPPQE
jgi:hypothetical protein